MKRVRAVWAHRTSSEYRSASLASEMLHWTVRLGLSPDTMRLAHRVVSDEIDHAELCFGVYHAAGGRQPSSPVPAEWLVLGHDSGADLVFRALSVAADEYAVAETVAMALFKRMNQGERVPAVAPVLRRLLEDEARHSHFGWVAVDELLAITGDAGRAWLGERVDGFIERVRREYSSSAAPCTPEETAWGLMSPAVYDEVVAASLLAVRGRFERLGVRAARSDVTAG